MTGIGILGARGRMGRAIAEAAAAAGATVAGGIGRDGDLAGLAAASDVLVDFTAPETLAAHLAAAVDAGTPLVIGTTGWDASGLAALVGARVGVDVAPNFSLGVALLRRFTLVLARFCAADDARDPYIVEHHQAKKHDAPSGTAKLLAQTVLDGCPRKRSWTVGGPVAPEQLGIGVLRAGSTYSEHRVGVDAPAEVLELTHTARSAAAFADGALAAARWIQGRKGVFTMDDVASTVLDPLFAGLGGGHA